MFASDFPISYSPETTHENMGTNATDWNQQPPESVPWGVYSQTRVTQYVDTFMHKNNNIIHVL